MINTSSKFILLALLVNFAACKQEPIYTSITEEPLVIIQPVTTSQIDTVGYPTKEPFIVFKDKGLEAYLVAYGVDQDNQVNGKIAERDLEKVTEIGGSMNFYGNLSTIEKKIDYLVEKYNLKIEKGYNINSGLNKTIIFEDLQSLKNLKNLLTLRGDNFQGEVFEINFENKLTSLSIPATAKFASIDACKQLTELSIMGTSKSTLSINLNNLLKLQSLGIEGRDLTKIEFNKNKSVQSLSIFRTSINNIDLSGCSNLLKLQLFEIEESNKLKLPEKMSNLSISKSLIENIDGFYCNNISQIWVENNIKLRSINLGNSKNIYSCVSKKNPSLTEIILNPNMKVDSTLDFPHVGGSRWQKDPWTKWVVKE